MLSIWMTTYICSTSCITSSWSFEMKTHCQNIINIFLPHIWLTLLYNIWLLQLAHTKTLHFLLTDEHVEDNLIHQGEGFWMPFRLTPQWALTGALCCQSAWQQCNTAIYGGGETGRLNHDLAMAWLDSALIITLPVKNGLSILVKWVFLCLTKPNDIERCL